MDLSNLTEKKQMKDKLFLDSNVILYAFGKEENKKEIAKELFRQKPTISNQVINEVINILFKNFHFPISEIKTVFNFLRFKTDIKLLSIKTTEYCFYVKEKYVFCNQKIPIIAK